MWWIYWLLLLANLSTAEQKKLALIDRFQNMKSKQRDHVIERRRKKVTAKERRNMPERRGA
jgi:ribosomal RNA-processing protein 36